MPWLGPLADAIKEIFVWSVSESGRIEMLKRRALRDAKEDAHDALKNNDLVALRECVDKLERLSSQP